MLDVVPRGGGAWTSIHALKRACSGVFASTLNWRFYITWNHATAMQNNDKASLLKRPISLLDLLQVIACCTALLSLLTAVDDLHRLIALFAHFKLLYFVAAILCVVIFLSLRHFKTAGGMFFIALLNSYYLAPWYLAAPRPELGFEGKQFKIIHANVNTANRQYQKVIELINAQEADVFVAQEVNGQWLKMLKPLEIRLPYKIVEPRSDNFGIALYSKYPLNNAQIIYLGRAKVPSISVQLAHAHKPLTIVATHPLPPISAEYFAKRNDQLGRVATYLSTLKTPIILIGDLNITMWTGAYRRLVNDTGLINARQGFGLLPSWPALLPFALIPIDHCLLSKGIEVVDISTGPDVGSDHLPLIVELAL
jgi:endonuclease/exonuclease/phosphatase (EEP) superfamily protein YafD